MMCVTSQMLWSSIWRRTMVRGKRSQEAVSLAKAVLHVFLPCFLTHLKESMRTGNLNSPHQKRWIGLWQYCKQPPVVFILCILLLQNHGPTTRQWHFIEIHFNINAQFNYSNYLFISNPPDDDLFRPKHVVVQDNHNGWILTLFSVSFDCRVIFVWTAPVHREVCWSLIVLMCCQFHTPLHESRCKMTVDTTMS
jgi:hypothetical protein